MNSFIKIAEALNHQWASVKEIQTLANCGNNKAREIQKEIINSIKTEGKKIILSRPIVVPMKRVVDYLDIDENYIRSRALKEIELNKAKVR